MRIEFAPASGDDSLRSIVFDISRHFAGSAQARSGRMPVRRGFRKEFEIIGVFVTFRYGDNFNEQAVRKIAEAARATLVENLT